MKNRCLDKSVIKRNMRFWGKYGLQLNGMLLAFSAVYGLFFANVREGFWSTLFFYLVLLGMMFAFIAPTSYGGAYIPLVMSFGSGRKEAVWGLQLFIFIFDAVTYVWMLAAGYIQFCVLDFSDGLLTFAVSNWLLLEGLVIAAALGQLCNAVNMRYGKKGMVLFITGVLLFTGIGAAVGIVNGEIITYFLLRIRQSAATFCVAAAGVFAVALYAVSVLVMFRTVKNYEVRV